MSVSRARRSGHAKRVAAHPGPGTAAPRLPHGRAPAPRGPGAARLPCTLQPGAERSCGRETEAGWGWCPQPWHLPTTQMGLPGVAACGWARPDPWRKSSGSLHLQQQAETQQGRDSDSALPPPQTLSLGQGTGAGDRHSPHTRSRSAALGSCGMEEGAHGAGALPWPQQSPTEPPGASTAQAPPLPFPTTCRT